jgi:hypothetical protein
VTRSGGRRRSSRGYFALLGSGVPVPTQRARFAAFLRWTKARGADKQPQRRVIDALSALEVVELHILNEKRFNGLRVVEPQKVIADGRKEYERRLCRADKTVEQARKDLEAAQERAQWQKQHPFILSKKGPKYEARQRCPSMRRRTAALARSSQETGKPPRLARTLAPVTVLLVAC